MIKNTRNQYLEEQIKQDLANGKISYEQAEIELDMMRNPQKYQSFKSSSGEVRAAKQKHQPKHKLKICWNIHMAEKMAKSTKADFFKSYLSEIILMMK